MLNIVHMFNYLGHAGTEMSVYNTINEIKNKANVIIIYSKDGPGRKLFEEMNIPLMQLEMAGTFDMKAAIMLKKICLENKVDVVHTHFLREHSIAVLSKCLGNKVKIINTRHMLLKNKKSVIYLNKLLSIKTDKIIAVSKAVEERLVSEGISREKISYIPNGIDIDKWQSPPQEDIRKKYNIDKDTLVITSIARFRWEKGHKFFIDSIKRYFELIEKGKINRKVVFLLVGDGALLESIKEYADELKIKDRLIFTGFETNIMDYLKASDLFICHSQYEAFGISILEAMACKLAVISTDSGGTREIIDIKLNNGVLVPYGDTQKLAEEMLRLTIDDELRRTLGENGHKSIVNKYDLKYLAEETLKIYLK